MSIGIKNGKHYTFNIYKLILFFFFIAAPTISSSTSGIKTEKNRVIVIDAGHGGKDPGAHGSISREKDITLAIALKTGEYIQKNIRNVTVIYTRKDDSTVDLRDRPKIANKANADLFISIHANWADSKKVMGAETYVMGHAKDQANLEVAMNENAVMLLEDDYSTKYEGFDPKSSESYIMFSLTQKVFQEQSTDLATKIQKQFRERVNRNDRDVKQAGFWVLYNTKMPSVLVETGFITNPNEEKYLNSKEGQDYLASSIYRACRDYLNEIDSKSAISQDKNDDSDQKSDTLTSGNSNAGEISFMVQVTTSISKTEIKPENFKGLRDITEIKAQDRFKYAAGSFTNYSDAVIYRKKIETFYPDAFVIAVKDNKILPLQQALEQKRKTQKDY
ncbi:MAG: N-acetylmuramoyl-L-alanine amidase [Bacteroidales bacterium]|jgi:N-acetylmuramoyl-L-alanine amidase